MRTYEAGILETLDNFWREGIRNLAIVDAVGRRGIKGYLR